MKRPTCKMLQAMSVVGVAVMLVSCAPDAEQHIGPVEEEVELQSQNVSLIELIADPESFRGERVRVEGFGVIEFEYVVLLLSEEDARYMMSKNGVWLDLTEEQFLQYRYLTDQHLVVEGVFRPLTALPDRRRGYGGAFSASGSIENVVRIERLLSRDDLEAISTSEE